MKATAVELQASSPPGTPVGVTRPPQAATILALSAAGLIAVLITGRPGPQAMQQRMAIVGVPQVLVTYPGFVPQGLKSRTGGFLIELILIATVVVQGSPLGMALLTAYHWTEYAEGKTLRRTTHRLQKLGGWRLRPEPGAEVRLSQGDTALVHGTLIEGSLTVNRHRWGAPLVDVVLPGGQVDPGDAVLAGAGRVVVAESVTYEELDWNPKAQQSGGVSALPPGWTPGRNRTQLWYWSLAVAAVTLTVTAQPLRALAVLLAGSPFFLDIASGAITYSESKTWTRRGVLPAHPLALVAAGEVETVLFDEPAAPTPERLRELQEVARQLRRRGYHTGLLIGGTAAEAEAAARAIGADLWFSGRPAERALWVKGLFTKRLVAVVGSGQQSVPPMATAHLAIAGTVEPSAVTAAHVTLEAPLTELPAFLADCRAGDRAELHAETVGQTVLVGATIAAALGMLAAGNVVLVAGVIGLGLGGLRRLLRRSNIKRVVAESR